MKEKLIYFDNAATTYPKPDSVSAAVKECIDLYGGNPGRGAHPMAERASEVIYACRASAGDLFGCAPERVVFTYSTTYALNFAIKGLLRRGDHVLLSGLSHNAVYRPVYAMAQRGEITFDVYLHGAGATDGEIMQSIASLVKPETAMIIATHQSNISSETEPIEKIGDFCRKRNIKLVVDGAQSGGHLPLDVEKMNITALCLPGHKGLYGVQGAGMLLLSEEVQTEDFSPLLEGGSGIHSLDSAMPDVFPEHLEAGTPGTPAIAGLLCGLNWVKKVGIAEIHRHTGELSAFLWRALSHDPRYTVYGRGDGGVVSFNVTGFSPSEVGRALADHGICTRVGYHCAPLAHRSLGSGENGSVRASFSYFNSAREVNTFLDVLTKLKKG